MCTCTHTHTHARTHACTHSLTYSHVRMLVLNSTTCTPCCGKSLTKREMNVEKVM